MGLIVKSNWFAKSVRLVSRLTQAAPARTRPNIILIMVDEMGYSDIGCFGGEVQTPFSTLLQKGGYQTAVIGKWHLGTKSQGFVHCEVLPRQGTYYAPDVITKDGTVAGTPGVYVTEEVVNKSIRWIETRDEVKPFMLTVQHKSPHRFWPPPVKYLREYNERKHPEPANRCDDYSGHGTPAQVRDMPLRVTMDLALDNTWSLFVNDCQRLISPGKQHSNTETMIPMKIARLMRILIALLLCLVGITATVSAADRPNVLLILCDDLGYSDLGCYGGEIQTPHLDRLAADGMRFTQFYNCAVCVMTRSALLTGLYPRQAKRPRLRTNMVTLGEAMRRAGYATSLTGKWHLGSEPPLRPIDRGFGEFYGLLDGCCNFFNPAKPDPVFYNGGRSRPFAHNDNQITTFPEGYYATDAFSDHAAKTIERFAKVDKPFFVHLCYTAPHFPLHAFAEDIERYRGKYSDGYLEMRERRHNRQAELGLFASLPRLSAEEDKKGEYRYDYDVPDWGELPVAERQREEARMETYAAMVDRMDRGIGRVLAAIEEAGVADNTVVMFLSDNGGCASWPSGRPGQEDGFLEYNKNIPIGDGRGYEFVGKGWGWAQNAPFRQFKTWCYEGGIATPMIVRWPGKVARGSITHQVGHIIDFMPTLLDLAESEYPREFEGNEILPVEGRSLLPVFHGDKRAGHESLSWELFGNRAIRQGDWKLVWGASEKRWELYDLKTDRSETNNLVAEFPERVTAMARDWEAWRERVEE